MRQPLPPGLIPKKIQRCVCARLSPTLMRCRIIMDQHILTRDEDSRPLPSASFSPDVRPLFGDGAAHEQDQKYQHDGDCRGSPEDVEIGQR